MNVELNRFKESCGQRILKNQEIGEDHYFKLNQMQGKQGCRMDDFEQTLKNWKQDVNNSVHRSIAAENLA